MMELVVQLCRATYTPIDSFLKLQIIRLSTWANVVANILKKENK
jgi:hypothetical protein